MWYVKIPILIFDDLKIRFLRNIAGGLFFFLFFSLFFSETYNIIKIIPNMCSVLFNLTSYETSPRLYDITQLKRKCFVIHCTLDISTADYVSWWLCLLVDLWPSKCVLPTGGQQLYNALWWTNYVMTWWRILVSYKY